MRRIRNVSTIAFLRVRAVLFRDSVRVLRVWGFEGLGFRA